MILGTIKLFEFLTRIYSYVTSVVILYVNDIMAVVEYSWGRNVGMEKLGRRGIN
jgi:hypothetical protein